VGNQNFPRIRSDPLSVGGIFRKGYENVELVSSKHITCFSDFRLPLERPDYMSFEDYLNYLADYCTYFNLWPHIRLNSRIVQITRELKDKGHRITYRDQSTNQTIIMQADALAICTGLHATPWIPTIDGLENLKSVGAVVLHSSEYHSRDQVRGKRVLVVGSGETAMDLVYESIKSDCPEVVLCHRNGWLSIPKVLSDFQVFGFDFKGALPIDGKPES
jgi:dimethylaniline monooxygenase (N-oxide forming)